MSVCCSSKKKPKLDFIGVPRNTRLTYQETAHYSNLYDAHAEKIAGKRVVRYSKFPWLLGLLGTDIAEKFADRIFKVIAGNAEFITKAEYFAYLELYHHGEVKERCRITFKLMAGSTSQEVVYKQNFIDYLNLILSAIKKVHPSAAENLLTEKDMEILFKKISKNREYFNLEDFESIYNKKPELLSWIDYFKNNDEDILFSMDNNIKKLLQESQSFFAGFYRLLSNSDLFGMLKGEKIFTQIISEIDIFCKKINREIRKINNKHAIDLKRILENPKNSFIKRDSNFAGNYPHNHAASSLNVINARSSKKDLDKYANIALNSKHEIYSGNQTLVASSRPRPETEKLNSNSRNISASNIFDVQHLHAQMPKNEFIHENEDKEEHESFLKHDDERDNEVDKIIEGLKIVKVFIYDLADQEISEKEENNTDTQQMPNLSIGSPDSLKNPNKNLNDSYLQILSGNNPVVKKLNFDSYSKNSKEDIGIINFINNNNNNGNKGFVKTQKSLDAAVQSRAGNIALEQEKKITTASKFNKNKEYNSYNQVEIPRCENTNSKQAQNADNRYSESNHSINNNNFHNNTINFENNKNAYENIISNINPSSHTNNGYARVLQRNNSVNSNGSFSNREPQAGKNLKSRFLADINPPSNDKDKNDENLLEEEIIISGLNENIRTPDIKLGNINTLSQVNSRPANSKAQYMEENYSENNSNCSDENSTIKKVTFKFNSHNNQMVQANNLYNCSISNLDKAIKNKNNIPSDVTIPNKANTGKFAHNKQTLTEKNFYKNVKTNGINPALVGNKCPVNKGIDPDNQVAFIRRQTESLHNNARRSRTFEGIKDSDPAINLKRKTSLRQRETIIFNQEDILEFLAFKEWKKKFVSLLKKINELILIFSNCLNTVDQSYSWIQKRFLKESLNKLKKSHLAATQQSGTRTSINKMPSKLKTNLNTNLKASDKNFKLLLNMIMGIQLAVQQNPFIDINLGDRFDHYIQSNIYSIQTTAFQSYKGETYYIKDFAGVIFEKIRRMFNIEKDEFIQSISPQEFVTEMMISSSTIIEELCSTGKSGSLFYYTRDGRYIIKSIRKAEYHCLKSMFKSYFEHLLLNPYTLLPIFFGCFKLIKKVKKAKTKIHFIIMQNIFSTEKEIHLRYDLKGSEIGRSVLGEGKVSNYGNQSYALKDVDLVRERRIFYTGDKRALIVRQIESDTLFLRKNNIIDYSLLIGIHIPELKRPDAVSENDFMATNKKEDFNKRFISLGLAAEHNDRLNINIINNNINNNTRGKKSSTQKIENSKFIREKNKLILDEAADKNAENSVNNFKDNLKDFESEISHYEKNVNLSESNNDASMNHNAATFLHAFKEPDGGVRSITNSDIYYFGIIDILTDYSCFKSFEYASKMLFYCSKKMSCVPPDFYQRRFFNFMNEKFGINQQADEADTLRKAAKK